MESCNNKSSTVVSVEESYYYKKDCLLSFIVVSLRQNEVRTPARMRGTTMATMAT